MSRAQSLHGKALTPLRTQVLEALWSRHRAFGAYDLLELVNKTAAKKLAPLSVYRALEFLVEVGLAHRLESINAYIGCPHPDIQHALQFLVCKECQSVSELNDAKISQALHKSAQSQKFKAERIVVEVLGLCQSCASHS
jgi:Fur family zinc uptake transcriptional regulator